MIKKWIDWINYGLLGVIALLFLAALNYWWDVPSEFTVTDFTARKSQLPQRAFVLSSEEYNAIDEPALKLKFSPLSVLLPDLRRHLVYYGKNGRPDANSENPVMFFGFNGNKTPIQMKAGERLYVLYDKSIQPPQYVFSANNEKKPLWIEATVSGAQASVHVRMMADNDQIIKEPAAYANFTLPEKEFTRFGGSTWELGKLRVDGTLLARQKAKWFGIDKFIEKYGGDEFKDWKNKQRIDFGDPDNLYSVYVTQGECLKWSDDRWRSIKVGESSLESVILCIKKIDDRVMNLELWDADGKGKIQLNLIKSNDPWASKNLENSYKFVGARTRSQLIFEINGNRVLLRPHDWLIFFENEWLKLETPQDIDDYVSRKLIGPLFVFDSIERKDDKPLVLGTLFNASRTEEVAIELSLQQNIANPPQNPKSQKSTKKKLKDGPPYPKQLKDSHEMYDDEDDDYLDD